MNCAHSGGTDLFVKRAPKRKIVIQGEGWAAVPTLGRQGRPNAGQDRSAIRLAMRHTSAWEMPEPVTMSCQGPSHRALGEVSLGASFQETPAVCFTVLCDVGRK